MFCGNCGRQIADDSVFCPECGTKIDSAGSTASAAYDVQTNNNATQKNKTVGIVVVAAAAVLVVILCAFLFGGRSYERLIKIYMAAQFEGDVKTIVGLFPDELMEALRDEKDMTEKEFITEVNDQLQDALDQLDDLYGDWTYSYKITDVDDLTKKKMKSLNEAFEDFTDFTITEAKVVTVELTITGDEDEVTTPLDIIVTKVGRSWYFLSMDGLF